MAAFTTTTWSPVSTWGAKYGRCLPRRIRATSVARRPSTRPSASTRCQARSISLGFGCVGAHVGVPLLGRARSVVGVTGPFRGRARTPGSPGADGPGYGPGARVQAAAPGRRHRRPPDTGVPAGASEERHADLARRASGPPVGERLDRRSVGVGHRHQAQPVGGGGAGGAGPGARAQHGRDRGRVAPAPADVDQRRPPPSGPSGGRTSRPRSRSAAGARPARTGPRPRPARWRRPPRDRSPRTTRPGSPGARSARTPRCPAAAGRGPGSRARPPASRRRRPWPAGRAGRRRARPPGPAAGRRPGRPTRGSGTGGRWPSGGRRSPGAPARPDAPPPPGASWRLSARTRAAGPIGRSAPPRRAGGRVAGRSTWTTWPRACTPASVRPAQVSTGGAGSAGGPGQRLGRGLRRRWAPRAGRRSRGRPPVVGDQEAPARSRWPDGGPLRRARCGPSGRCPPGAARA